MTSADLPGMSMSQCEAYEFVNIKTSRPVDNPYVPVDTNASAISSAAVAQKEDDTYEATS